MTALAAPRDTAQMQRGGPYQFTVAAGVTVYNGALVALNASGLAVPGSVATTLTAVGRAEIVGALSAGPGELVNVRPGIFRWANSASGDAITAADFGKTVYIVDDQTVAKTTGSNTRSAAGICRGVDAAGVWVETV